MRSRNVLFYIILIVWAVICLYPLLWMFGASLKLPFDVMKGYNLFPKGEWHWETYGKVWEELNFFDYFTNSVSVTLLSLVGINILYTMAAYALAKVEFSGKMPIFYLFLGMMFVPGITILIPLYLVEDTLGLLDTHLGLVLPTVNGAAPMAIFLFRNYFRSIPHELFESAKMEGASSIRILFGIYIPLAVPALATVTILNFLASWNTVTLPMILLSSQKLFTLPLALIWLDTGVFRQWNVLMTGALITIIPVLLTFVLLQRYYVQGLTTGAVKS